MNCRPCNQERRLLVSLLDMNISLDFILEMKEAFQLYDKSGDGFLDSKEMGELMRSLGRNPTEEEIYNIMAEVDVDHNGKLDFEEFVVLMNEKLTEDPIEMQGCDFIFLKFVTLWEKSNWISRNFFYCIESRPRSSTR